MKKQLVVLFVGLSVSSFNVFADGNVYLKNEYNAWTGGYRIAYMTEPGKEHYLDYGNEVLIGSLRKMKIAEIDNRRTAIGLDLWVRWSGTGSSVGAMWNQIDLGEYGLAYNQDPAFRGKDLVVHYGYSAVTFEWLQPVVEQQPRPEVQVSIHDIMEQIKRSINDPSEENYDRAMRLIERYMSLLKRHFSDPEIKSFTSASHYGADQSARDRVLRIIAKKGF